MNRNFDVDSPLMSFLNRIADLVILNILFILCCLPVVTAGAAFTALHYVCYKIVREEDGYIVRDFFKGFRQNFRQATLMWLLFLMFLLLVGTDMVLMRNTGQSFPTLLRYLIYGGVLVVWAISLYAFPLQARFENPVPQTLKNAALLVIGAFPRTLAMMVVMLFPFLLLVTSLRLLPVVVLLGFSGAVYACAALYAPVFKRIEPETEETGEDDWKIPEEPGETDK